MSLGDPQVEKLVRLIQEWQEEAKKLDKIEAKLETLAKYTPAHMLNR